MFRQVCTFDGCTNEHRARGLCSSHLDQLARGKELTPLLGPHGQRYEHCTFPDCGRDHHAGGLCTGHASQRQRGQPLRRLGRDGRWVEASPCITSTTIKHDNRPENLQLWHTHQPRGASVEDTVRWARWFLDQYGEEFPMT
jgi:hypothetical protein